MKIKSFHRAALLAASNFAMATSLAAAIPQSDVARQAFDLPAQDLGTDIRAVGRKSGREIMFSSDIVAGKAGRPLRGTYTADEAIDALLMGSGLVAEHQKGLILIRRAQSANVAPVGAQSDAASEIVVTGSRIRGAPIASPTITLDQSRILAQGNSTVADAFRDIPQNFSGGQNPGVAGSGDQGGNQNINSASTINLRGLGADATLTLINGHRVSYDSIVQGVDIGSIPLAALDRIEVVTDGASALYGSDAVAGVANIILKKDYQGLTTDALIGGSTDGGNLDQQYDAVTGQRWSSGGFIGTFQYSHASAINASDRSYTRDISPSTTLIPDQTQYSGIFGAHQELTPNIAFDIDALYNTRRTAIDIANDRASAFQENGSALDDRVTSFSVSPRLRFTLPAGWEGYVSGSYGRDVTKGSESFFGGGSEYYHGDFAYRDRFWGTEGGLDGALVTLPAGEVKLAIGAGYRSNGLTEEIKDFTGTTAVPGSRTSYYGFGEISVPLIGPSMDIPLVYGLHASGALRYERYPGVAQLATPKLGLIYSPTADFDLSASWGRSFKTPTLFQQFYFQQSVLSPASSFGYSGAPNATVLEIFGGNRNLKPETANGLTLSVSAHPRIIPGLKLELSYYEIRYKNRIIEPVQSISGLLGNPGYANLISLSPSAADLDAIIAASMGGLNNVTALPYDPNSVVAVVDDRNRNAERQNIHGLDIAATYGFSIGAEKLTIDGSASYLHSSQRLNPTLPAAQLAGIIFNPPHWRARTGIEWDQGGLTVAAFVNYIGGVTDDRFGGHVPVGDMVPIDLSATYRFEQTSGLQHGLSVRVSALNAFNDKPAHVENFNDYDPPYDSTNYSVVGRFLSLTISKTW